MTIRLNKAADRIAYGEPLRRRRCRLPASPASLNCREVPPPFSGNTRKMPIVRDNPSANWASGNGLFSCEPGSQRTRSASSEAALRSALQRNTALFFPAILAVVLASPWAHQHQDAGECFQSPPAHLSICPRYLADPDLPQL